MRRSPTKELWPMRSIHICGSLCHISATEDKDFDISRKGDQGGGGTTSRGRWNGDVYWLVAILAHF